MSWTINSYNRQCLMMWVLYAYNIGCKRDVRNFFGKHLDVLMGFYCEAMSVKVGVWDEALHAFARSLGA